MALFSKNLYRLNIPNSRFGSCLAAGCCSDFAPKVSTHRRNVPANSVLAVFAIGVPVLLAFTTSA